MLCVSWVGCKSLIEARLSPSDSKIRMTQMKNILLMGLEGVQRPPNDLVLTFQP